MPLRHLLALALCCAGLHSARGHSIWIEETPDKGLCLRFGEIGEVIETSPGRLDAFKSVRAWAVATNQFEVTKQKDHFLFAKAAVSAVTLAEDQGLAVSSRGGQPARKPNFYARWQPAKAGAGTPGLTLDVVPEAKAGTFRVYFRGQPLAGAKLATHSNSGAAETALETDAEGRFTFVATKPGLYLIICSHREPLAGFAGGLPYEAVGHNCTLSFRQP